MHEKCKLCQTFQSIPKNKWVDEYKRLCPISNKLVSPKDGCEKLTLVTHVHCSWKNQRVAIEICIHNAKTKKHTKCVKCKQNKELILIFWKLNRKPMPIVKPIIKKTHHPIIKEK